MWVTFAVTVLCATYFLCFKVIAFGGGTWITLLFAWRKAYSVLGLRRHVTCTGC